MKKIIVSTDFSENAWNACQYALQVARVLQADILLFHVFAVPVIYTEMPVALDPTELQASLDRDLGFVRDKLLAQSGGSVKIECRSSMGNFYTSLEDLCNDIKPALVLMGCQGKTAAEHLFMGSHAVHAMQDLQWPIMAIPPNCQYTAVKVIGLACDLKDVMDSVPVAEIQEIIGIFQAKLVVLNTGKSTQYNPDDVFESGMLGELLYNIKPEYHFIAHKDIDEGILAAVEELKIDLLIVIPKRHGLVQKILHRSHTRKFVLQSQVPVMALHHV